MSPRPRKASTIADIIADAVRAQLAAASAAPSPRRSGATRRAARSSDAATSASSDASASAPAAAPSPVAADAAGSGEGGASRPADGGMSLAAKRAADRALIERVREDLKAAYEGAPVSPDRIAFRLKEDRDLVDAALTLLVTRKEARAKWLKGRVAYTPAFPH